MKIAIIGGGPAGLYFGILMKKADPTHRITVFERNLPFDTFGWGVVFSDRTLENLYETDALTQRRIVDRLAHWDDIDVHIKGRVITSGGHGFRGIERKQLLNILRSEQRSSASSSSSALRSTPSPTPPKPTSTSPPMA